MKKLIDKILPSVVKPARYIGGELNSINKPSDEVEIRFGLAFPDLYEVGMSNLGLRILYHILNSQNSIAAERIFAPAIDMENLMRENGLPLFSLESKSPVCEFDIVGFSLAYEMTFTTVLNMLDLARIPLYSNERNDSHPIIIAGGHCTSNPEPMSPFIDAFAIGDGEEIVLDIIKAYKENKRNRHEILKALNDIDGVYVPSIDDKKIVRARVVRNLNTANFPDKLVVSHIQAVHDRAALEIMRGCARGCRFCHAGMITRPVRERSFETLLKQSEALIENTGYEEIALTSLSSADHSEINELVTELTSKYENMGVGLSLPSLRADAGCVSLAAEIQKVRKSGLTFAPEAGSQRLRDVINKNVSEVDLLGAVEAAVKLGWRRLKLYFMIGLPTETDEDLECIANLVSKVVGVARANKCPLTLNITISPFVPKPHTPFQWRAMATLEELEHKIAFVRPLLRGKNIKLSWHEPYCSRIEAAIARGDNKLSAIIYDVWKNGGKFEQDRFNKNLWDNAFETENLKIEDYANVEIPKDTILSWEHIIEGVSKEFLIKEDEKAQNCEVSSYCRKEKCSNCGVRDICDELGTPFDKLRTVENLEETEGISETIIETAIETDVEANGEVSNTRPSEGVKVMFRFNKGEDLKWLGHLDLIRIYDRAVRMSGINAVYTQGFNPRPKMSIASALPLGATADNDIFTINIAEAFELDEILEKLNSKLPGNIRLHSPQIIQKTPVIYAGEFELELFSENKYSVKDLQDSVDKVLSMESIIVERVSDRKIKKFDIRPGIESIKVISEDKISVILIHREFTVKPSEVVKSISEYCGNLQITSIHRSNLNL